MQINKGSLKWQELCGPWASCYSFPFTKTCMYNDIMIYMYFSSFNIIAFKSHWYYHNLATCILLLYRSCFIKWTRIHDKKKKKDHYLISSYKKIWHWFYYTNSINLCKAIVFVQPIPSIFHVIICFCLFANEQVKTPNNVHLIVHHISYKQIKQKARMGSVKCLFLFFFFFFFIIIYLSIFFFAFQTSCQMSGVWPT